MAGLIFDDQTYAMSPSNTNKCTRRYRYCKSQAFLLFEDRAGGSVVCVPEEDLGTIVVNELKQRLETPLQLLEMPDTEGWPVQKAGQAIKREHGLASKWDGRPSLRESAISRI